MKRTAVEKKKPRRTRMGRIETDAHRWVRRRVREVRGQIRCNGWTLHWHRPECHEYDDPTYEREWWIECLAELVLASRAAKRRPR